MKTINEEIAELRKRLDELEGKQSKGGVFVPREGVEFWYLGIVGDVYPTIESDCRLSELGNCYPTKEAAEQVVLNRKIHRFLQEQTDFVADWSNHDQDKYNFIYDHEHGEQEYEVRQFYQPVGCIYFRNRAELDKAAEAAIDKFGLEAFEAYLKGSICNDRR